MSELSLAAKAVDDAFWKTINDKWNIYDRGRAQLAAALEAVADQVVPEEPMYSFDLRWMYERDTRQSTRSEILAIAAELRCGTTTTESI